MTRIQFAVFASILASSLPAMADEAPAPPQQATDLKCLVGRWDGKGTMKVGSEKPFPVSATYRCRDASGGFGLSCHLSMTGIPGLASYELDDVWGYDAGDGQIHWFSVSNAGETHDHKGTIAGTKLTARFSGKRDGATFVEDVSMAFDNKTTMRVRSLGQLGGKVVEDLSITMTRKAKNTK